MGASSFAFCKSILSRKDAPQLQLHRHANSENPQNIRIGTLDWLHCTSPMYRRFMAQLQPYVLLSTVYALHLAWLRHECLDFQLNPFRPLHTPKHRFKHSSPTQYRSIPQLRPFGPDTAYRPFASKAFFIPMSRGLFFVTWRQEFSRVLSLRSVPRIDFLHGSATSIAARPTRWSCA